MKRTYVPPEFNIVNLSTPDCLTTSGETWTGPDYPGGGGETGGSTDIGGQGGGDWWGDP